MMEALVATPTLKSLTFRIRVEAAYFSRIGTIVAADPSENGEIALPAINIIKVRRT